ncbi:MAG TPA: hypothetical protein O0X14_03395 [Methanocorpusculum sp.]|nr:hypothetical protein [Methanocorpusculum sp.]
MITDACIFANGDDLDILNQMIITAKSCGISQVVVYNYPSNNLPDLYVGTKIRIGHIINEHTPRSIRDQIKNIPNNHIVMVKAGDNSFNRMVTTIKRINFLTGITELPKGGFDHIVARMAADTNTGIVFDLSQIINPQFRRNALLKYAEILNLHRKYKFPVVISSGANNIFGIKNYIEIVALCSLFGMNRQEVHTSLTNFDSIINPKCPVRLEGGDVDL